MKIALLAGTRPEYIKIAPVYRVFKADQRWQTSLVSTGQHDSMLSQLYDFFEIRPDYDLQVMQAGQSLESLTSTLLTALSPLLEKLAPDFILVQGDTTTTFVAALAAFYQKIPVIHLEAGLRTGHKFSPFPEEVNRQLTSTLADYHFCPTELARANLKQENIHEHVYQVGNTVVDSLLWAVGKVNRKLAHYEEKFGNFRKGFDQTVLITAHRRESFGQGLAEIAGAIRKLAGQHPDISFIFPVHLNPQVRSLMYGELGDLANVFLLSPRPYDAMVFLMSKANLIMTDSGGIQEEAPSLSKPVLVMRPTTERPEAVEAGFCTLCGTAAEDIIKQFNHLLKHPPNLTGLPNPYGKGDSAQRLKQIMDQITFGA